MLIGRKKRVIAALKRSFGVDPFQSAAIQRSRERLTQIRILYDTVAAKDVNNNHNIDEVTWSDLEMDEVFLRINRTQSYIGEQALYMLLHSG